METAAQCRDGVDDAHRKLPSARLVVWAFSTLSIADLGFATVKAVAGRMYTYDMSWNWYLLNFYVPLLVVSQVMIVSHLRKE